MTCWSAFPFSPADRRTWTTTPSSPETIELPDCTHLSDDTVTADLLDALDRARLVRDLAERGIEGAKALAREADAKDPRFQERMARLRERLRRQASRRVGRVLEEYDRRVHDLELVSRSEMDRIAAERARLEARLAARRTLDLSRLGDPDFWPEVEKAFLLPESSWMKPPPPPGWWARLWALLLRIVEFFRRLFRRRRKPAARPEGRPFTFAVTSNGSRTLGASEIGDLLGQMTPNQREEFDQNLRKTLKGRERDLQREAEEKRRQTEAQRDALEREREEARRRAEREQDRLMREAEERRLTRELKERGLVAERRGQLAVTFGLIEQFARLVLEEEERSLPGDVRLSFSGSASTGVYEKARLRQPEEIAHLDLPSSLLAARLAGSRHIDEAASYVYREITSERVHVVVMFDKSGSMAEGGKLVAAKKALLALYVAIRRRHSDATIDVVAFDNEIRIMDLLELWECAPGSFTNTGEGFRTAHLLLRSSRANRKEVFVVTDGLPESYTDVDGRVRSGNLEAAMANALARAQELATIPGLKFSMILLKSDHPEYELAARTLTRTLAGDLVMTEPDHLGVELLVRWARGTETIRRAPTSPSESRRPVPAPTASARGRRKKADRRMGG